MNDIKRTIERCPVDDNRAFIPIIKSRNCPYCNEPITITQVTFGIVKKMKKRENYKDVKLKRLEDACGWNCSRKQIDKLNANRTEEEIAKGIYYDRF